MANCLQRVDLLKMITSLGIGGDFLQQIQAEGAMVVCLFVSRLHGWGETIAMGGTQEWMMFNFGKLWKTLLKWVVF